MFRCLSFKLQIFVLPQRNNILFHIWGKKVPKSITWKACFFHFLCIFFVSGYEWKVSYWFRSLGVYEFIGGWVGLWFIGLWFQIRPLGRSQYVKDHLQFVCGWSASASRTLSSYMYQNCVLVGVLGCAPLFPKIKIFGSPIHLPRNVAASVVHWWWRSATRTETEKRKHPVR